MNDNIDTFYSSIDKNVISNLCKDNNLKNLIHLSTQTDIHLFNKRTKKSLKNKSLLLKECETKKKKELKKTTSMLSNLAKLNNINEVKVKNIYENLENKIVNIDKMIDYIKVIDTDSSEEYIECFSNC